MLITLQAFFLPFETTNTLKQKENGGREIERERERLSSPISIMQNAIRSKGLATTIKNKITHFSFFVPDGIISLYINPNS